jgi:lysophospholipase L1-like esterase
MTEPGGLSDASPEAARHGLRFLLAGLLFSALVILICLAAGELVLRRWFPFENVPTQLDARYLYKYIPNTRRLNELRDGRPSVMVEINREGRRGPLVSPSARPRIVVYGDSFIAGEDIPYSQTFVADLERNLRSRLSKPAQVIDAGVMGYGPDQESLVMEDELGVLKPDLAIVAIYGGNDYGDLLRDKLFLLDSNRQLVEQHPQFAWNIKAEYAAAAARPRLQLVRRYRNIMETVRYAPLTQKLKRLFHVGHPYNPPPSKPRTALSLLRTYLDQRAQEYQNTVIEHDPLVYDLVGDTLDLDISTQPASPSAKYKALLMRRILERMQDTAAKRTVPCVFLFIPAAVDATDRFLTPDPVNFPGYQRSRPTDVLEQIATDDGMLYVNLFKPFLEHRTEELYHHTDGDHWSAKGQQFAANLMTDYILSRGILSHPVAVHRSTVP